ncbi:MAG: ribonuclease HII [Thaumarchaeota archaeon]|jgi:ribonuclease HII|nr:ribonuclease HII [Candidatus Geocrenenecus arthurdayi]MCL7396227.1 ribonuclease HII [Candidatus Geocrenenecus arthurdayi]MCL7403521.1 ribonuclease HII [Candidatus Geocrenenecus arthurdayi]
MGRLICGIDEAGRGSVIGPMVIAGILINEEKINELTNLKVRDSKEVKPEEREKLYDEILKIAKAWKIIILTAKEVDSETRRNKMMGINHLEARKFIEIINELKPDIAYIDLPSRNPEKFRSIIYQMLKYECQLILEHKADKKYPATSAASIIAKVTRDGEIKKLKEKFGDFGSGYPHDPKTRRFIREILKSSSEAQEYIRLSWQTIKRVMQTRLEEHGD